MVAPRLVSLLASLIVVHGQEEAMVFRRKRVPSSSDFTSVEEHPAIQSSSLCSLMCRCVTWPSTSYYRTTRY